MTTTITPRDDIANATRQTVLTVDGMSCSSCVRHIDRALRDVDGVEAVEVHLRERRVVVRHGAGPSPDRLVDAVSAAGYEARVA